MAARTGAEYIKGLQAPRVRGLAPRERVKDVTTHPQSRQRGARNRVALRSAARAADEMTYVSPTSGERLGSPSSFRVRKTIWRGGAP